MHEAYLSLPRKEQALILKNLSTDTDIKRDALLLEKDIWICKFYQLFLITYISKWQYQDMKENIYL